jgi:hypothetical protein
MRKITTLISGFVIAAGLLGGAHPALALNPDKSIREIKAIAEAEGLGENSIDKVTDKFIGASKDKLERQKPEVYGANRTGEDSRYVLLGIGGTTLDPQPGPLKPVSPETPKEPGISPPVEPLTPQPEPHGAGTGPQPAVATPGEAPKPEQVKEEEGSPKPAPSKAAGKKRKKKGKTTAERAKPGSTKKVKKPSETSTVKTKAPPKHPTPMDVTKSLKSQDAARPTPKPETKGRTTPSTGKKGSAQPGTPQR